MLHAFLPPVDVELSLTYGGHTDAQSDCRSIILHAHVLTEPTAVMVLDHKGRIQHATAKLAGLLGYPVSKLRSLDFDTLLPQPICQMHGTWFKVGASGQCVCSIPGTVLPTCSTLMAAHPSVLLHWHLMCRTLRRASLPPAAGLEQWCTCRLPMASSIL
jgi:hypothetical protein